MAKINRVRRLKDRSRSDKAEETRIASRSHKMFKGVKKPIKLSSEKKDWEDAKCSVCMEAPHNAVLLLCSSYHKGCRPYMCATSYRFSNCLDQYKKAYAKTTTEANSSDLNFGCPNEKTAVSELLCPLCRGQVKGWTLVEPARKYLNKKKRTCMEEKCSFVGNFKQLKKHVKAKHPLARPRKVDPSLEQKWKSMENEREINDVISTLPPGSVVLGDYVIDPNTNPFFNMDMDMDDLFSGGSGFRARRFLNSRIQFRRTSRRDYDYDSDEYEDEDEDEDDDDEDEDEDEDENDEVEDVAIRPIRRNFGNTFFFGRSRLSGRRWF